MTLCAYIVPLAARDRPRSDKNAPLPFLLKGNVAGLQPQFHHDVHESVLVLSVDDDPVHQVVMEHLLAAEGYVVQQATGKCSGSSMAGPDRFSPVNML